jgi:tetratricopeptide (TPR) repeat protein
VIRILVLVAALAPAPVQRSVDQIADAAEAAFNAKNYEEAATGFAEAFARQPHPGYLWAQAQAERFGGNCRDAIDHYRQFIALDPGDAPTRDAEREDARARGRARARGAARAAASGDRAARVTLPR